MSNCKACMSVFKKKDLKISCVDCVSDFHGKCVRMTQADIDCLTEQNSVWRCDPCNSARRKSMRLEHGPQEGGTGVSLEDIMKTLKDIQSDQKKTVSDFNTSYEVLHDKLQENTNKLASIESYIKEIEVLKSENTFLKSKINFLENRVDELENYSRRNCLELQGIPEERTEDIIEVVQKVGIALDVQITPDMIDACHRIGKQEEGKRPRGIVVKFVRRNDRDTLVQKRRQRKGDFSTRHLGLPSDTPVYINDSLSPARRKLFFEVRQLKRDKGYKYIWMRNGNILLRKEEGSPVITIKCQADLSKLK